MVFIPFFFSIVFRICYNKEVKKGITKERLRMELVQLEMELPPIFHEIEEILQKATHKTESKWMIAGGSLCNLYIGEDIKDIDIFFEANPAFLDTTQRTIEKVLESFFVNEKDIVIETEEISTYRDWMDIPVLYRIVYKGMTLEFILCDLNRVLDFDLRFRQFYLLNGIVHASKAALSDIEQKKLTIVNPRSPISTLSRLYRFQEQFGFDIEQKGFHFLLTYFNYLKVQPDGIAQYVKKNEDLSEFVKEQLVTLQEKTIIKSERFEDFNSTEHVDEFLYFEDIPPVVDPSIQHQLFDYLYENKFDGFGVFYEDFLNYKPIDEVFRFPMDMEVFRDKLEPWIQEVNEMIHKYKLRCVTQGIPLTLTLATPENYATHAAAYFENESLSKMVNHVIHEDYSSYSKHAFLLHSEALPSVFEAKLEPTTEEDVVIGDVLKKNAMILVVNNHLRFRVRKCTNGKYTIAGLAYDSNDRGESILLKGIGILLKRHYPDVFDFGNPELEGICAYSPHYNRDYYFYGCEFKKHYLNEQISVKTTKINLQMQKSE